MTAVQNSQLFLKGRGAQYNPHNNFIKNKHIVDREFQEHLFVSEGKLESSRTEFLDVNPKSIVNKVNSLDLGFEYSMNPYQGCEHGCVYCYARNTHEYWGYSAGEEFEQKILIKRNAAELLEKKFQSKNWKVFPIVLSGNTDCYQPIERKLKITRELLKTCLKYQHPVSIITKNHLIQRDLDIIKLLNKKGLISVTLSITTLNETLKNKLEPRTSSVKNKLETIRMFSEENISVGVMMAPIIPALNESEIFDLVKSVAKEGASGINYTIVRLNGEVGAIFKDWIQRVFPDRADKVMRQIKSSHGGQLKNSRFGTRMSGEGPFAENIRNVFNLARRRYLPKTKLTKLNNAIFRSNLNGQLSLF